MNQIEVRVKLFGAFRQYSKAGFVAFKVPSQTTVSALKDRLADALKQECPNFDDKQIIADSVFAGDSGIVAPSTVLSEDVCLAVLPPVCGG